MIDIIPKGQTKTSRNSVKKIITDPLLALIALEIQDDSKGQQMLAMAERKPASVYDSGRSSGRFSLRNSGQRRSSDINRSYSERNSHDYIVSWGTFPPYVEIDYSASHCIEYYCCRGSFGQ